MSVQSEIDRIITAVGNAYSKVSEKGGMVPASQTVANLATTIESIPGGKPEQSKTLTLGAAAPSTVTPDSGKVLSSVPVELDTSVIKAENIKKDVTMLGVTGTHEGGGGGGGYSFTFPATATNFPRETKLIFADGTMQNFQDFPSSLAGQTFHNVIMWGWANTNYLYPVYDVSFTGKMINYSIYANSSILQNNFSTLDYLEPPVAFYICEDIVMTKFIERNDE